MKVAMINGAFLASWPENWSLCQDGRKDADENQFKGFSRAGRRRGRSPEVADERGAGLQVEGAISQTSGSARCTTKLSTATSLRIRSLCRPADLLGDGCRRKR